MMKYDVIVIGGGPAGMAAALKAYEKGCEKVLIIERDKRLGGILNQCIHHGFGLQTFKEELTGPTYAQRYIDRVNDTTIEVFLNTMVLDINCEKIVTLLSPKLGKLEICGETIIFAMGCRERTREAITIPGNRCAGIYTAGTAQYLLNVEACLPGKDVIILGSGDIGLIMARRLTLEGANVKAVFEVMDRPGGLNRNIAQCLDDYGIPLYLNHTVTNIIGDKRISAIEVAEVDRNRRPIAGTEKYYECDTLLLSVGLIPEVELLRKIGIQLDKTTKGPVINDKMETSVEGFYACGNVAYVHDLVDIVTIEGEIAGHNAAKYVNKELDNTSNVKVGNGNLISMVVPQIITNKDTILRYRVSKFIKKAKLKILDAQGNEKYTKNVVNLTPAEMHHLSLNLDTSFTESIILSLEEI